MSVKNISENVISDDSLEQVSGGVAEVGGINTKKGARATAQIGIGALATANMEMEERAASLSTLSKSTLLKK